MELTSWSRNELVYMIRHITQVRSSTAPSVDNSMVRPLPQQSSLCLTWPISLSMYSKNPSLSTTGRVLFHKDEKEEEEAATSKQANCNITEKQNINQFETSLLSIGPKCGSQMLILSFFSQKKKKILFFNYSQ